MFNKLPNYSFSTKRMQESYIVAAKRTPIGKYLGKLAKFRAPDLAGFAIQKTISDINLDQDSIDEVIMGVALPAALGQNPARQAALAGGISKIILSIIKRIKTKLHINF